MKRIGLMGCGKVAAYGHLPVLHASEDWDLHAIFDPDAGRLAEAAERFAVPHACTDVDAFFQAGLDAVAITSPAPCHAANVADAARHGCHILCEKPLAMDEAEGTDMVRAAAAAGVMLATGFDYRFSPVSMRIRDMVSARVIGDVLSLRLVYIWNCHGKYERDAGGHPVEQARRAGRMEEGGPMVDCGVHQIDLARWWLGSEVARWSAAGAWVDDYEAPDHLYLHMDHECGAHSMVEISYSYCHTTKEPLKRFLYELIGTEGLIRYDREAQVFEVRTPQGTERLPFAGEKNFAGMYEAFYAALGSGDLGDLPSGRDGVIAAKISREATNAAMAGRLNL